MARSLNRDEGRRAVEQLVSHFQAHRADFEPAAYNELTARTEFINPLFEALGWDVTNELRRIPSQREVKLEIPQASEEGLPTKRPDYLFRRIGEKRFYVEAKKPQVSLENNRDAAFQVRQYGHTGGTPICVLTNFRQLAIYDSLPVPTAEADAREARLHFFNLPDLLSRFDDLYNFLSRESVMSGQFDELWQEGRVREGSAPFDEYFLSQVQGWRRQLAEDIAVQNAALTDAQLTWLVQRLINRIVFLRVCEGRGIEPYESLKYVRPPGASAKWQELLRSADSKYNSGLFRLLQDQSLPTEVNENLLTEIVLDLYLPRSPYNFVVVGPEILGAIYERFLGQEIVREDGGVSLVDKPEIAASGGVVPTPQYIVDSIIERTLRPLTENKAPDELNGIRVVDLACGSGVFLVSAFQHLMDRYIEWYLADGVDRHVDTRLVQKPNGDWRLTLAVKRNILLQSIYGVDIDLQAVEVSRFSLLLKLLEEETSETVASYTAATGTAALPLLDENIKQGNSLIDNSTILQAYGLLTNEHIDSFVPFQWEQRFEAVMRTGGFDAVVGNPPYIRIQNMRVYASEEVDLYNRPTTGFTSAGSANFDKYFLFVERALTRVLKPGGRLGMIVTRNFFRSVAGRNLRQLILAKADLDTIVDFGVEQVFPGRSTYTCILVLSRKADGHV